MNSSFLNTLAILLNIKNIPTIYLTCLGKKINKDTQLEEQVFFFFLIYTYIHIYIDVLFENNNSNNNNNNNNNNIIIIIIIFLIMNIFF